MMRRSLRAVGEAVPLGGNDVEIQTVWPCRDGLERHWYVSGTAALAAACLSVRHSFAADGDMERAEIIVPAYTCPDVISAIKFAGVRPVLCDFVSEVCPRLDPSKLSELVNVHTAAVIAVSFQGIPEDIVAIRDVTVRHDVPIIYDYCQGFSGCEDIDNRSSYTVFSFGRGKPASTLGGGALIVNRALVSEDLKDSGAIKDIPGPMKARLYNVLIRPRWFGMVSLVPGANIGETVYKPLRHLVGVGERSVARIARSIAGYRDADAGYQRLLRFYRNSLSVELDVALSCGSPENYRLLRLPLIMPDGKTRDDALQRLRSARLGASSMYPGLLFEIPGVPVSGSSRREFPHASAFSDRLLTLPIHSDVTEADVAEIAAIVNEYVR